MDIYLVWGFLGSGKTTLINHLLSGYLKEKKVVVLENESGKESVDGSFLKSRQFSVVDMKAGCICCTLRLKLVESLHEISRLYNPDVVLIEPSGLASLEELQRIPNLNLSGVISLLDVGMYDLLMKLNAVYYQRQFYSSSVVFLTKLNQIQPERIEEIKTELLTFQPELTIVDDYRQLNEEDWRQLFNKSGNDRSSWMSGGVKFSAPEFLLETIPLNAPLDRNFFGEAINRLNHLFGNAIIRAKGLIKQSDGNWLRFDSVGGESTWMEVADQQRDDNGFLTIWWNKEENVSPVEWIQFFLQAREVDCNAEKLIISDKELYGYMGYKGDSPDPFMMDYIRQLKEEALSVCHPHLGFRFLTGKRKDEEFLQVGGNVFHPAQVINDSLQDADFYVTMISTVGPEFEAWLTEKQNSDDVMAAFVADAIGSSMVESIVAYGQHILKKFMARWNLKISNAYSPGYCDWEVSEQSLLFSLLPHNFCGVTLTESCMMVPIKSVSTLISVGKEMEQKPYGCAICKKLDCYKRGVRGKNPYDM